MRNKGLSFYKKKKKISQELLREIFSWIFGIALSVFLAAVLVIFLGKSTRVVGMSMEPTLENGQQIFIDRFQINIKGSCQKQLPLSGQCNYLTNSLTFAFLPTRSLK